MKFTPIAATMSAMVRVITLIPVFPRNRSIAAAVQSVNPIRNVAMIDAAASSAFASQPGLSLERVIMMPTSAGPTSKGNAKRCYRHSMDIYFAAVNSAG